MARSAPRWLVVGAAMSPSALLAACSYIHAPGAALRDAAAAFSAESPAERRGISMRMPTISKPGAMSRDERLTSRYGGWAFEPEGGWADAESYEAPFSYEDMASTMKEIVKYTRGDRTKGTILGFEPNGALVDIGAKSSAYCALTEAALLKPDKPEMVFSIGEEYEFSINSREDENGQLMLSRRRILTEEAWETVTKILAEDKVVEATVSAVNRGGAMMSINGLRAFLPGSHYLPGQNPPESLVGSSIAVKLLDVDQDSNRLVCSHRKAMVDQTINNLQVGSVLRGIITAVKPYGAFVDVGGMSGLLHISQISCDHIGDVNAILPMGTVIKCMVISQDKGKGRVALSTKTLESEPGEMLKNPEKVFAEAEATAAKYQERLEAERKAREEAAQDVIFGLESVFADPPAEAAPAEGAAEAAAPAPLEFEES